MRHALMIAAIVVSHLAAPAAAIGTDDLPQIDVDAYCAKAASSFNSNTSTPVYKQIFNECVSTEQSAYESVKLIWGQLSPNSKLKCTSSRMNDPYQYTRINACGYQWMEFEEEQREANAPLRKFRR
jgi:hypothetical protein